VNTARAREISGAVGIVALMVFAVLGNMLAARHYRRWDVTAQRLFTLSPATLNTLGRLEQPVEIYVLIPGADPLQLTVRHLLDAYRAETDQLRVEFVDPDTDPAAFLALQQKFQLSATKTEGGQIAADAVVVVARGDRRHFISPEDLFEVEDGEEMRARPRVERELTTALRTIDGGAAPSVCFTTGHAELDYEGVGLQGLLPLRQWLEKANFESRPLPPRREVRGRDPIADCRLVIVAGPAAALSPEEAGRLRRYFDDGGNLLIASGPELDEVGLELLDVGLDPVLAAGGLLMRRDIVFENSPGRQLPNGQGELFFPEPQRHPVTAGFVEGEGAVPIPMTMVSSLALRENATVAPRALLMTTEASFGMASPRRWLENGGTPQPTRGDAEGPLAVAYAIELPKRRAAEARGPRMVVFGSKGVLMGGHWLTPRLRGTGLVVESAIAWLTDQPEALDVPDKPMAEVEVRVTASTLYDTLIQVLLLPLSVVIFGLFINFRRRTTAPESTEGDAPDAPVDEEDDDEEGAS